MQNAVEVVLADVSRYFGAAVKLIAGAIAGVEAVEAAQVPSAERSAIADELLTLRRSISNVTLANRRVIDDLTFYITSVRSHGAANADDARDWIEIQRTLGEVSETVRSTFTLVSRAQWLQVALTPDNRLALEETLRARSTLLSKLQTLPPPSTTREITQLERMNIQYVELFQSLRQLNVALVAAADRIKPE